MPNDYYILDGLSTSIHLYKPDPADPTHKVMTRSSIDLMIYDFGAISVIYSLPIDGPFEDLLLLNKALYDDESLQIDSRLQVDELLHLIGDAARRSHSSPVFEDYVVFHVERFTESIDIKLFCIQYATQIAQILRGVQQPLSDQEIQDAVAAHISYSMNDVLLVDSNAALLVESEGDDVRALLEFANIQLLEMRYVDKSSISPLTRRTRHLRVVYGICDGL